MRLSAKFLKNVANVNNFDYVDEWQMSEGSAQQLYLQLVDLDQDGLRFLSQATVVSLQVTFLDIDTTANIVVAAVNEFSDDKSIWRVDLTESQIPNPGKVDFSLTQDGTVTKFVVNQAIQVDLLLDGSC